MSGMPGKSGGKRIGAGRKPNAKAIAPVTPIAATADPETPLGYLLSVVRDPNADIAIRIKAAIAACPYLHARKAPSGKKEEAADAAKAVSAASKFAVRPAPPRLLHFKAQTPPAAK